MSAFSIRERLDVTVCWQHRRSLGAPAQRASVAWPRGGRKSEDAARQEPQVAGGAQPGHPVEAPEIDHGAAAEPRDLHDHPSRADHDAENPVKITYCHHLITWAHILFITRPLAPNT